jgi:hypothetical protein
LTISYNRYESIKTIIAKTLQDARIRELPICPFVIINHIGSKIIPYSSLPSHKYSACMEFSQDGFTLDNTIYYNDIVIPKKIRFTLMHEIGHIVLKHNNKNLLAEAEANFFAQYILAPPVLIYANDSTVDMNEIKIQDLFNVTSTASEYIYQHYTNWLNQNSISFGIKGSDLIIFNAFYQT